MTARFSTPAALGVLLLVALPGGADEPGRSKEEKALRQRAEAFVAAFNKGDAKALAGFWTEEGDYIDQLGRHRKGRQAIEAGYEKLFAGARGGKLRITILSVRLVKPDLAIEDGITEVFPADGGPPSSARYSLVHVKQDEKWLVASVREAIATPPSNHEHLEGLEFLVGDWTEDGAKGETANVSYGWAQNQHFLVASFTTTLKDVAVSGGTQWIGWDPSAKHIRSWSFDSGGGFGEGVWSNDGNRWTIKITSTLRDGKKVTATNVITKVDDDHLTWQSTKRAMDDKELPDTPVIKFKRLK